MTDPAERTAGRASAGVVAVTGSTGTIGREVVAALAANDPAVRVRAIVRDAARAAGLFPDAVEVRYGDFDRPDSLVEAFTGAASVLLLCGHHPEQLTLERAGLAAAITARVPRLVYVSAAGAGDDPVPTLAADHRRLENELARAGGPAWVVARPTAVFASLLGGVIRLIGADGAVPLALGRARVNVVDAGDLGAALAMLLLDDAHDGQLLTLTGPASLSGDELVAAIGAELGRDLTHVDLEPEDLTARLQAAGAPPVTITHLVELFGYFRTGDLDLVTDDLTALIGRTTSGVPDGRAQPAR